MMKGKLILFSLFFVLTGLFKAQVANDLPCNPFFLGTLPAPNNCPNVTMGDSIVVSGTTVNAVCEPVTYGLMACNGGGNMNPASPDVWFKFVPTAERLNIRINGLGTNVMLKPGISLYHENTGQCMNLTPIYCETGTLGQLICTVTDLIPYEHYYLQVRGTASNSDAGDFTLQVQNGNDCLACGQDASVITMPHPVAGTFPASTPVTFEYKLSGYRSLGGSLLKAVLLNIPVTMWDTTNISFNAVPAIGHNANGVWRFMNLGSNVGFYFDADGDGNVTNDGGDPGNNNTVWIFKFTVKTLACTGNFPSNLAVDITNQSDGVFFGSNLVCNQDPVFHFKAVQNCCSLSSSTSTSSSCIGVCNGNIQANASTPNSMAYPLTVVFTDGNGNQEGSTGTLTNFTSTYGTNGSSCSGNYNIFVTDVTNSCVDMENVQIINGPTAYHIQQMQAACGTNCTNQAAVATAGIFPTGTGITWQGPLPGTTTVANGGNATNLCPGWYYVNITTPGCSTYVDSVEIINLPGLDPYFEYPPSGICIMPDTVVPYIASPGGTFAYLGNPIPINPVDGSIFVNATSMPGGYDIIYTTPGNCPVTDTQTVYLVNQFDAFFNLSVQDPYCKLLVDTVNIYTNSNGGFFDFIAIPTTAYLDLNQSLNQIYVQTSSPATFMLTYAVGLGTPCAAYYTDTLIIKDTCLTNPTGGYADVIYNAISPNGDGYNDFWTIPFIELQNNDVSIYNRYGMKVWQETNYNNLDKVWKGRDLKGGILPEGTYFYLINLKDENRQLKGWVELTN